MSKAVILSIKLAILSNKPVGTKILIQNNVNIHHDMLNGENSISICKKNKNFDILKLLNDVYIE
jgi:hypothetical protein